MEIHIVLDNIRSCFNVGSIFRSADGAGYVKKIYLCGITADTGNPKLEKTALGATHTVPSQHYDTTQEALEEIRKQNQALELEEKAKQEIIEKQKETGKKKIVLVATFEVEVNSDIEDNKVWSKYVVELQKNFKSFVNLEIKK